ncbi:S41 family peptidase [Marinoscillum sp. MHG1-6]|uniref:S41 family peptidase n=1 Tax=Marinoscillum sp. MHG1-6 TaxID=2959627 RepID=UPI0021583FE5|nr:S41 family peptidase [Marinoscillum sp. MHG1-6]
MKKRTKVVSVMLLSVVLLLAFVKPETDRSFEIIKNLDIFITAFKEVNSYYVDEINPTQLMKTGLDAMLSSLDPYTDYIPEDAIEDYRTITTGEYGGIGALVDKKNGVSTIVLPYEGYPAYRAGLIAGDQILEINGFDISDKSSSEISHLLKGQSKSELTLLVRRYGKDKPFKVTLEREKITINNVPYYGMVTSDIGYIKLTDFTTGAGQEVRKAVVSLKDEGAKKIILDLRGNPGGLLNEAVNVSNVFVDKGLEVVTTKGKIKKDIRIYKTLNTPTDTEIPLAVLTSRGSASASEIVSGVMQDYDRGVLVGQKTYGKGLVQQTRPLAYNSQLKVTTSKYYIPSGRCIQAIDYGHRNEDGSVGKIPDSLKAEFKTSKGRPVYDGGGVDPDITVEVRQYAPITYELMGNELIFDYATRYRFEHESIVSPKAFRVSDQEYDEFVSWLQSKNYDYTTQVEKDIDKLTASAKKEKYYNDIAAQIENLKKATLHNKGQDLQTFKDEIKALMEQEICGRYYLQDGIVESTFSRDLDIRKAIEVLEDANLYEEILRMN